MRSALVSSILLLSLLGAAGCGGELPWANAAPELAEPGVGRLELAQVFPQEDDEFRPLDGTGKLYWRHGVSGGYVVELFGAADGLACEDWCAVDSYTLELEHEPPLIGGYGETTIELSAFPRDAGWWSVPLRLNEQTDDGLVTRLMPPESGGSGVVSLTFRGDDGRLFASGELTFTLIDPAD